MCCSSNSRGVDAASQPERSWRSAFIATSLITSVALVAIGLGVNLHIFAHLPALKFQITTYSLLCGGGVLSAVALANLIFLCKIPRAPSAVSPQAPQPPIMAPVAPIRTVKYRPVPPEQVSRDSSAVAGLPTSHPEPVSTGSSPAFRNSAAGNRSFGGFPTPGLGRPSGQRPLQRGGTYHPGAERNLSFGETPSPDVSRDQGRLRSLVANREDSTDESDVIPFDDGDSGVGLDDSVMTVSSGESDVEESSIGSDDDAFADSESE